MHPSVVASGDGRRYAIPTPFLLVNRALQPCLICDGSKLITARDKAALGMLGPLYKVQREHEQARPKRALAVIFPCRMYVTAGRAFYPLGMDALFSPPNWRSDFDGPSSQARCVFALSPASGRGRRHYLVLDTCTWTSNIVKPRPNSRCCQPADLCAESGQCVAVVVSQSQSARPIRRRK